MPINGSAVKVKIKCSCCLKCCREARIAVRVIMMRLGHMSTADFRPEIFFGTIPAGITKWTDNVQKSSCLVGVAS